MKVKIKSRADWLTGYVVAYYQKIPGSFSGFSMGFFSS